MFDVKSVSLDWAGRKLTLETGKIARQADGAVYATWGETALLATVVYAKEAKPGQDFFPLTVNYQEKYFASGRIPGGFFKREGRPTEKETLVSRLIDRPIRPLFVEGYRNETQVVCTVLQHDLENDPDIVAMVATSAALTLSGVPFMGPVGAAFFLWDLGTKRGALQVLGAAAYLAPLLGTVLLLLMGRGEPSLGLAAAAVLIVGGAAVASYGGGSTGS